MREHYIEAWFLVSNVIYEAIVTGINMKTSMIINDKIHLKLLILFQT